MIVFINYVGDDHARQLVKDLQNSGVDVTFKTDDQSDAALIVLTPASVGLTNWQSQADRPFIPLLMAACDVPASLRGSLIDLTGDYAAGYGEMLKRLRILAGEQALNPYKGLLPYTEFDAPYFHGRQGFVKKLQQHIADEGQLIVLVGDSGSGKTSIVNAGLVATLRNSGETWLPIHITPEDEPMHQLSSRLQPLSSQPDPLASRLEANPEALGAVLDEITPAGARLLLIVDSFEMLFTRCSVADRVYFLEALHSAIRNNQRGAVVVLAIHANFLDRLTEYPLWASLLRSNMFNIRALTSSGFGDVIGLPVEAVGESFEADLPKRIIADIAQGSETGALPRLSFILWALFASGQLTHAQYEALGGVNGALIQHAETVFKNLPPIQQRVAQRVMLSLVDMVDGSEPMTRTVQRERFTFTWVEQHEVDQVVATLIANGLLTQSLDIDGNDLMVGLSHEFLLREWPRYATWVEEEQTNLRYSSRLEKLAGDWVARGYTDQVLMRGVELEEALGWLKNPDHLPSQMLRDYVTTSGEFRQSYEARQQKQTKKERGTLTLASAMAILFAILIVAGVIFTVQTIGERDTAFTQRANTANQLATSAAQNQNAIADLNAAATAQQEAEYQVATLDALADIAATAQANAEANEAEIEASYEALAEEQGATATYVARAIAFQATAEQVVAEAATAQADAQATAVESERQLHRFLAQSLIEDMYASLPTNPALGLRLAAEAATLGTTEGEDNTDGRAGEAMRDALEANINFQFSDEIVQGWFLNNNTYAVIDYAEGQDELWRVNPPQAVATLSGPVEQIIPVAGGQLFLVDYSDDTPDELWKTEDEEAVLELNGDIAPPLNEDEDITIPNMVQLEGGAYFVLKYEDDMPGELWETATTSRVTALDGDYEKIVPLANGLFFADYVDRELQAGIWEDISGEMVQAADDVITTIYDNEIFAIRRAGQFDEIWHTDPFEAVTEVIGRVDTVTTLGPEYFVVRYLGGQAGEIWRYGPPSERVFRFRGSVDVSNAFLDDQYFFVRYADQSPSELWSIDPLDVIAILHGNMEMIDPLLGGEEVAVDYTNNTISEVWALESASRLEALNGDLADVIPILGDVYFVALYEGEQPAEVWSAINLQLVGALGDQEEKVSSITALKGGSLLVVLYEDVAAEIWEVDDEGVRLLTTLADVATRVFPIQNGDYVVVDFANNPAQIFETATGESIVTLDTNIAELSYNPENQRVSYTGVNGDIHIFDLATELTLEGEIQSDAELLALICVHINEGVSVTDDELAPYLAGLPPSACVEEQTSP